MKTHLLLAAPLVAMLFGCNPRAMDVTCDGKFARKDFNKHEPDEMLRTRDRLVVDLNYELGSLYEYSFKNKEWDGPQTISYKESPDSLIASRETSLGEDKFRWTYTINKKDLSRSSIQEEQYRLGAWVEPEGGAIEYETFSCKRT